MKASQIDDKTSLVTTCNPYIAGFGSCGTSPGTMKPGFVYPTLDIFYANWDYVYWSGVLPEVYFNQTWDYYVPMVLAQPGKNPHLVRTVNTQSSPTILPQVPSRGPPPVCCR